MSLAAAVAVDGGGDDSYWCYSEATVYVIQAACTSWKRVLSQANGAPSYIEVHSNQVYRYVDLFSRLSPAAKQRVINKHFKFMFVRNPFERLVSAHRDKFVDTKYARYTLLENAVSEQGMGHSE